MGEEFYCIIKLVSGEEIFSLISVDESEDNPIIILQNPVVMVMVQANGNSFVKIKPWMELSSEDIFMIRLDKVITMTECSDGKLIDVYKNYISCDSEELISSDGKVKLTEDMGYKGSVDDFRNKLEDIYKGIKES
jgi:hypothetical protein